MSAVKFVIVKAIVLVFSEAAGEGVKRDVRVPLGHPEPL
jgi:hypothetical protein